MRCEGSRSGPDAGKPGRLAEGSEVGRSPPSGVDVRGAVERTPSVAVRANAGRRNYLAKATRISGSHRSKGAPLGDTFRFAVPEARSGGLRSRLRCRHAGE